MQKSRLIERIAELINEKKLPLVADVRDEFAEDIRLVIEPRARTVDPALMMESLFKLTELESRIPLNMNVLIKGKVPRVIGLAEALREWLDHRRDVLVRRSNHRLKQIDHRLEVLGGYLIAYLNLDRVIKIIRTEDEPKPVLMKAFKLTDVQADAILNMRLRNLRKLEEMEIRKEDKELRAEKKTLEELLEVREEAVEEDRGADQGGARRRSGRRRRSASAARFRRGAGARRGRDRGGDGRARADHGRRLREGLDPRAARPRRAICPSVAFKADDKLKLSFFAETTSKFLVFATNGRFYTLDASKLPGGRGHGEPVRLFIDLEQEADIVAVFPSRAGASSSWRAMQGRGFVVAEDEASANTRKGKQVLNVKAPDEARAVARRRRRAGRRPSARTARC